MPYSRLAWLLVPSLLALVSGCTAKEPVTPKYDTTQVPPDLTGPEDRSGCAEGFNLGAPQLKWSQTHATQLLQPFRGSAPGATQLTASGPFGTVGPATVNKDGSFCIEVKLKADQQNSLLFVALDANGCGSPSSKLSVLHKTVAKPDGGIPTPINLARGQKPTSGSTPKTGTLGNATDGSQDTSVSFSFFDYGKSCAWLKLDLGRVYQLTKFQLRWGKSAGQHFGYEYKLLISSQALPVDPICDTSPTGWVLAHEEKSGVFSPNPHLLSPPKNSRWAALLLYEDADTSITDLWEDFDLAELEVWGQTSGSGTTPDDKCP